MKETVLFFVVSLFVGALGALIFAPLQIKIINKGFNKRLKKEREKELIVLMSDFVDFFNQFETLLETKIALILTQKRGGIQNGSKFDNSANSVEELIIGFFYSGKYIMTLGEQYNKRFNNGFENMENYKEFLERFMRVKKYYSIINNKPGKTIIVEQQYYLSL